MSNSEYIKKKTGSTTLGEKMNKLSNKIINIYLTSKDTIVFANSVVIIIKDKPVVFKSVDIINFGYLATSQQVSDNTITEEIIQKASKLIKFSEHSSSARLSILQMEIERIQNVKSSCSIKNGKRK